MKNFDYFPFLSNNNNNNNNDNNNNNPQKGKIIIIMFLLFIRILFSFALTDCKIILSAMLSFGTLLIHIRN